MLILLIIMVLLLGLYFLFIFPTHWLKVERVVSPIGLNEKIVQISDIHIERNRVKFTKIHQIIQQENPHYIVLTGDFLDTEKSFGKLEAFLRNITQYGLPVYAVYGNHDYRLKNTAKLDQLLQKHKVRLLKNESVDMGSYSLIGIDDYCSNKHDIEKAYREVDPQKKKLIITHDPNIVLDMKNKPFDYMMTGHLHGKQVAIPFLFWLKPMGEISRRGVYQGLHPYHGGLLYISKGIGQSGINIRLFVRSEITIHEL
jgi:predicted MPP superfamily phosphohydrolase